MKAGEGGGVGVGKREGHDVCKVAGKALMLERSHSNGGRVR